MALVFGLQALQFQQFVFVVHYDLKKLILTIAGGILTFILFSLLREAIDPGYVMKFVLSSVFFVAYVLVFNYELVRSLIKR